MKPNIAQYRSTDGKIRIRQVGDLTKMWPKVNRVIIGENRYVGSTFPCMLISFPRRALPSAISTVQSSPMTSTPVPFIPSRSQPFPLMYSTSGTTGPTCQVAIGPPTNQKFVCSGPQTLLGKRHTQLLPLSDETEEPLANWVPYDTYSLLSCISESYHLRLYA
ncbi:galactose oxidase/kelch repeat superfamily protein [Striga asiatica]|uniref:Galactose oxidase/kelch repeat superfamily protein n=1 Tax=Striga asiatica TaxID=4170 RepID=A0A5A7QCU5_STRAF|nr:galactose oxidase/kelch repeat superfamily protein [Striga asiatica]